MELWAGCPAGGGAVSANRTYRKALEERHRAASSPLLEVTDFGATG
jgi:hypothetical protein